MIDDPRYTLLVRDVADWPTRLAYLLLGCLLWMMMIFGVVLVARSDFVRKGCLVVLILLWVVIVMMMIYLSGHLYITSELGL